MSRTRIKFCGLTRPQDVDAAVAAGADAVGFVCYAKSPRYVAPDALALLAARVPAFVTPVLLFVNAAPAQIEAALRVVPHALLQFHGDESPAACRTVGRPYLRALRMTQATDWTEAERAYPDALALLVDAPAPGFGGGGQTFDWTVLPPPQARRRRLVLAGGLNAANVGAGVRTVQPFGVDVSSGIEDAPGLKNAQKMREFAAAVFAAHAA